MLKQFFRGYIACVYLFFYFVYHYGIPIFFAYQLLFSDYQFLNEVQEKIVGCFIGVNFFFVISHIATIADVISKKYEIDYALIKRHFFFSNGLIAVVSIIVYLFNIWFLSDVFLCFFFWFFIVEIGLGVKHFIIFWKWFIEYIIVNLTPWIIHILKICEREK